VLAVNRAGAGLVVAGGPAGQVHSIEPLPFAPPARGAAAVTGSDEVYSFCMAARLDKSLAMAFVKLADTLVAADMT